MSRVWTWIRRIFTRERVATVWKILFNGAVTATVSILTNEALMNAAYEISLSILGIKDTPLSKATLFNLKLETWCVANGIQMTAAQANAVREVAYAAVCAQREAQEEKGIRQGAHIVASANGIGA